MQIHTKYQFQCNQSIFLAFKGCKRKCQQKKNINPNIVYIQCVIEINTLAASSVYCSLISQIKSLSRKMIHFSPLLSMLFLLTMIFFFSFIFSAFPSLFLAMLLLLLSELNLFDETKS